MVDTMVRTIKGSIILSVEHKGQRLTLSRSWSLYEIDEFPEMTGWMFEEMDRELYARIGFIPRDREWYVVSYGEGL